MDKRFLLGTTYRDLVDSKEHAQKPLSFIVASAIDRFKHGFSMTHEERKFVYHHPAVVLNASVDHINMDGLPMHIDHDFNQLPIGRIHKTLVSGSEIKILAEVWDSDAISRIDSGELKSLSIGYQFDTCSGGWHIGDKKIREVSLVSVPFFKDCDIIVAAMGRNERNKKTLLYKTLLNVNLSTDLLSRLLLLMASPPTDAPGTAPAPGAITPDDLQQLMLEFKRVQTENDNLKKRDDEYKKLSEDNLKLKKQEEERLLKVQKQTEEELTREYLALHGMEEGTLYSEPVAGAEEETPSILTKEEYEAFKKLCAGGDNDAVLSLLKKTIHANRGEPTQAHDQPPSQPAQPKAPAPSQGRYNDVYNQSPIAQNPRLGPLLRAAGRERADDKRAPYARPDAAAKKPRPNVPLGNQRPVAVEASGRQQPLNEFEKAVLDARAILDSAPRYRPGTVNSFNKVADEKRV